MKMTEKEQRLMTIIGDRAFWISSQALNINTDLISRQKMRQMVDEWRITTSEIDLLTETLQNQVWGHDDED